MEIGVNGTPTALVPCPAETVLNQEPVHVVIHPHQGVVVTVLEALLSQLVAIMEYAQVKNKYYI